MQPVDQLEPEFLLDHARRLTSGSGRPYTADTRRAASAAYYAAYHATAAAAAGHLFGGDGRLLGVRWFSHQAVINASRLVSRLGPATAADPGAGAEQHRDRAIWEIFQAVSGAQIDLLEVMDLLRSLKVEREIADYDRTRPVYRSSVRNLVSQASTVVSFLTSERQADTDTQVFLGLVALRS